ncbi:hypothetical protein K523DRAFT_319174 [Schizophyllum commune Tattone D]|nr:hypothetical protein K523DRAFT_319174 [Schizophyllum commune Tattone D]
MKGRVRVREGGKEGRGKEGRKGNNWDTIPESFDGVIWVKDPLRQENTRIIFSTLHGSSVGWQTPGV